MRVIVQNEINIVSLNLENTLATKKRSRVNVGLDSHECLKCWNMSMKR